MFETDPVRVLVVDDDDLFAETLRLTLAADARFEVVGRACDGVEALSLVRLLDPDVVLMDVHMPRLDGLLATIRLRATASRTRVVILSGAASPVDVERAYEAGAVGFVAKGWPAGELAGAVLHAARLARPFGRRLVA
jgi:DNA-binding NarL/FixJ family response regulator